MSVERERRGEPSEPSWTRPTRLSGAAYAAKVAVFRARRVVRDLSAGPPILHHNDQNGLDRIVGESRTPLMSDVGPEERDFQLGKIQNLRLACRALEGLRIPAGGVFSFWRQVGPPSTSRGYVQGRMLQEGCMVAATGGGLCQLSNALYDVALQASCRIIERHPHSRVVPGSAAARGRDATVAWNYVDLRFSADRPLRLSARLERDNLVIRLFAQVGEDAGRIVTEVSDEAGPATPAWTSPRSCGTCEEVDCHLHRREYRAKAGQGRVRAFLVDEAWPEFRAYVSAARQAGDRLGRPFDGGRLGSSRYDWGLDGFDREAGAFVAAMRRSLAVRGAGGGGALRRAELGGAEAVARALGRLLTHDVTDVTVAQSYLPYLWRDGLLGGRCVTVLMTRLPMAVIQARLDAAAARHPERATLSDFRAPAWMVTAETEALSACDQVITPHAEVAALFGDRAARLAWAAAARRRRPPAGHNGRITFPGPTAARKGAFAVREAAMALDLEVAPLGAELEGANFWNGLPVASPADWAASDVVVHPALVEHEPRLLLAALAAGSPVIATRACGLDPQPGLTLIPADDAVALIAALRDVLGAA